MRATSKLVWFEQIKSHWEVGTHKLVTCYSTTKARENRGGELQGEERINREMFVIVEAKKKNSIEEG
jgi:hypothetical protein